MSEDFKLKIKVDSDSAKYYAEAPVTIGNSESVVQRFEITDIIKDLIQKVEENN